MKNWCSPTKGFLTWLWECAACATCETDFATSALMTGLTLCRMERSNPSQFLCTLRMDFFRKKEKKSPFSYVSACNLSKNPSSSSKVQMWHQGTTGAASNSIYKWSNRQTDLYLIVKSASVYWWGKATHCCLKSVTPSSHYRSLKLWGCFLFQALLR